MKILFVIAVSVILVGCQNPLSSEPKTKVADKFRPGADPEPQPPATEPDLQPVPALGLDTGVKIGPGFMRATGTANAAKAAITINDVRANGAQVGARLSFSKSMLR